MLIKCIPRRRTDQLPDKHSFVNSFALLLMLTICLSVKLDFVSLLTALLLTELIISHTCHITLHGAHTPIREETLWLCPSLVNSIHHFFLHPALLEFHLTM